MANETQNPRSSDADHRQGDIQKAMEAVRAAIPAAERDVGRPVYHFRAPAQWLNDPNGTLYHQGWHHLFYQHNPFAPTWGPMHWGHARSRDAVNWEHLPIALWPSVERGEDHCFSGGACQTADGAVRLIYTSIGKREPEQWMAVPRDQELLAWDKVPDNPIASAHLHQGLTVHDWRDPFLFTTSGHTFMVTGGNLDPHGGHAVVLLYEALNDDLTQWRFRGPLFRHPDKSVRNIECPNFFELEGRWVLLISPHRSPEYFVGAFDPDAGRFMPETHGIIDPGAFYATNVAFDDAGRCLMFAWCNTHLPVEKGWNGAMTLPRILTIGRDGHLRQTPIPALDRLHGEEKPHSGATLSNGTFPIAVSGNRLEARATFEIQDARSVGLRVNASKGESVEIGYAPESGWLSSGGHRTFVGIDRRVSLRVFLDGRMLEVFANEGEGAILSLLSADPGEATLELFARDGTATVSSVQAWEMRAAAFDLAGFR